MSLSSVADKWKQIQGIGNWDGMLDPLDEDLCKELIRYSQLNLAILLDTRSPKDYPDNKWYGYPLHTKSSMFDKANFKDAGYTVRNYLYWSTDPMSNSITPLTTFCGYIAVSDDKKSRYLGRRDILITFRGSVFDTEWGADLSSIIQGELKDPEKVIAKLSVPLAPLKPLPPDGDHDHEQASYNSDVKFGEGWLTVYTLSYPEEDGFGKRSARNQITSTLKELLVEHKDEEVSITVTGHSLGAAVSALCAYDIVNRKINVTPDGKSILVTAFSFASPKVGNKSFKKAVESMESLKILRITNISDLIPKLPPLILGYADTGVMLPLDPTSSKYLRKEDSSIKDDIYLVAQFHDPEAYRHLISGRVEFNKYHQLVLVNRNTDLLLPEYGVPPMWTSDINADVEVDDGGCYRITTKDIQPNNSDYN